jgi:hypothetical protein
MKKTMNQISQIAIAGILMFGFVAELGAKDKLDILKLRQGMFYKEFSPVLDQTYVFHTNNNLWMGWDSYGNTGDQTCSAIIPGWVYPGCFTTEGGKGFLNYNCRAGYWIVGKVGGEFVEGTTGEYVVTRGTEPGLTTMGWAGTDSDYNKEPWVSVTEWTIKDMNVTVQATRRSWSFPGVKNHYFKVGAPTTDFDFNDFVLEDVLLINTGTSDVTDLILGGKADHDAAWNVPFPDWDFPFWTDDQVDYDEVSMATHFIDGDNQGSAANDFGIDDDGRDYRNVRVGQVAVNLNGKNHDALTPTDITHMWWTGDEDPQTPSARHAMASLGFSGGDKKGINPSPMDMRYLQAYGPFTLAAGDTVKLTFAVIAGSGMDNVRNAAAAAKQAYDWNYNLPKPPSAPSVTSVATTSTGAVKIDWAYTAAQQAAVDPDIGSADFSGFREYRTVAAPASNTAALFAAEGVTAEDSEALGNGADFPGHAAGPYKMIAEGSASDFGSGSSFSYTDEKVAIGLMYWYYVAAYDKGGSSATHGTVPSLESYYTMCYPMVAAPDGSGNMIPTAPPATVVSLETLTYKDLDDKESTSIFVSPNPWKLSIMSKYHGADNPTGYFMRFYNVKSGDIVKIYDVTGNLVYASDAIASSGSWDWNLLSRTRNQVSTGVYFWKVGATTGKLAVIR